MLNKSLMAALALIVLTNCSRTPKSASPEDISPSGFLGDYSKLVPGKQVGAKAVLAYKNPDADFSKYDRIIIDGVSLWRGEESRKEGISPENAQFLVDEFYYYLVDQLGRDYNIVTVPNHRTLRLQVAVTKPEDTNVVLDTFTTIAPPARIISEGKELFSGKAMVVGAIGAEAKVTDATTGEILYMVVDRRFGRKTLRGVGSRTKHAEAIIKFWAKSARARLCELRGQTRCGKSTLG